jgi:hypothetical protein
MSVRAGWGAALGGHQFDLEDWRDALKPPFDPWVVQTERGAALCSKVLDVALSPTEVQDRSKPLIEMLNGALAVSRGTRSVSFEGVIEFMSDGSERRHVLATLSAAEGRSTARAFGVAR